MEIAVFEFVRSTKGFHVYEPEKPKGDPWIIGKLWIAKDALNGKPDVITVEIKSGS